MSDNVFLKNLQCPHFLHSIGAAHECTTFSRCTYSSCENLWLTILNSSHRVVFVFCCFFVASFLLSRQDSYHANIAFFCIHLHVNRPVTDSKKNWTVTEVTQLWFGFIRFCGCWCCCFCDCLGVVSCSVFVCVFSSILAWLRIAQLSAIKGKKTANVLWCCYRLSMVMVKNLRKFCPCCVFSEVTFSKTSGADTLIYSIADEQK